MAANHESARDLLWAESINTANDMENISSNTLNKKSPYELFTGKQSKLYGNLVEFGRIGQIALRKKNYGKERSRTGPLWWGTQRIILPILTDCIIQQNGP
jgi:hypothetical protein